MAPRKISVRQCHPAEELVYNLEVDGEHVYCVATNGLIVHNTCAGLHHFVPQALGSIVPYGDKVLTGLNSFRHTKLHRRLSEHLEGISKTVNGVRYTMNPKRGQSGAVVRSVFSRSERIQALTDFYRKYNGGEYYSRYLRELSYTIRNGLII